MVHILKLKPIKREVVHKETFVPTFSDVDGSSETNTEAPCTALSEEISAQDVNPSPKVQNIQFVSSTYDGPTASEGIPPYSINERMVDLFSCPP